MPGQDLSRVTIPPFFLEPRSLLERMADMLMHPELLLEAAAFEDPVARMQGMLKWYLSGFHYKTTVRGLACQRHARAPPPLVSLRCPCVEGAISGAVADPFLRSSEAY